MNINRPKVSVIITTFNRANYIRQAIESVFNQSYQDFEIIVIDDGSTDNTREILKKYNNKIRYLFQENRGLAYSRKLGASLSKGNYIAFLDSDDVWLPEKLKIQVDTLDKDPELALVCSESYVINDSGEIVGHLKRTSRDKESYINLFERDFILTLTVIVRRQCYNDIGGFDETLLGVDDYDCWLRLASKYKFKYLDFPLSKYRIHEHNMSKNLEIMLKEEIKIFKKGEIKKDINFFKRRVRISKLYYLLAEHCYTKQNYANAEAYYLKAVFTFPLLGYYQWPKETENFKFSLPYRLCKVYFLIFVCALVVTIKHISESFWNLKVKFNHKTS